MARCRARWVTSLLVLGTATLGAGGARAQQADTGPAPGPAPTDPNVIRGLQVTTGVTLDEILTDNARGIANGGALTANAAGIVGATAAQKQGDLITRVTPNLSVFDMSRRVQAGLSYSPSYEKFLNAGDLDRFDNALTATGKADLWENRLVLDGTASVSREIINAQGALATPGIANNNNQTTVSTYTVGPTFNQPFGDFAVGQVKYQFGSTSSGSIAPATQNAFSGNLTSGTDFNDLQWVTSLSDTETSQGATPNAGLVVNSITNPNTTAPLSQQTAEVDLNYALTRSVTLRSGFGYDKITDNTLGGNNINGPFGSFGVGVTGSRLTLNLNYNLRYNSQFVSMDGAWDVTDKLRLTLNYGESIQTQQSLLIQQAGNIGLTPTGGFIDPRTQLGFNPLTTPTGVNSGIGNAAFLDKHGEFTAAGNYDRNSWSLTALSDTESSSQSNFNQTSLSFTGTYGRELTPNARANVNLSYLTLNQTAPLSTSSDLYSLSTGYSYDLGRGLSATTTYSFLYRRSSTPGQDERDNSLTLSLNKTF
jgi:uncharacterized protein (PEP-CTERM system associated)